MRRISRRSGSNFYRSFWLLPKSKRDAMCALYAFARITDDLGDCNHPISQRTQWLMWWRDATECNLDDSGDSNSVADRAASLSPTESSAIDLARHAGEVLPALRHTVHQFKIPPKYLIEIIDGVLADQQKTRFDTYEQLEHYCYLVASAVGLACLHIWGFHGPLPLQSAIDCGLAFQLTNILRDISEDAQRGRIYLPRQHYEQHGLCEDDLLEPRADDRLRCLIDDEIERAKRLFDSGWNVWDSLDDDGRAMFSMMWRTYRRLLQRIEEDPRAVATKRVRLSTSEKLGLVSRHFISPIFRRLPVPPLEVATRS